jgi:hypothetical protein
VLLRDTKLGDRRVAFLVHLCDSSVCTSARGFVALAVKVGDLLACPVRLSRFSAIVWFTASSWLCAARACSVDVADRA